jgi:hypothetical protein
MYYETDALDPLPRSWPGMPPQCQYDTIHNQNEGRDHKMKRTGLGLHGPVVLIFALVMAVSCGTREEKEKSADTVTIPAVSSVEILPENPSKSSLLETVVKFNQPETAELHYRWMKNGKEIMGETESTLKQDNFQKGDTIAVEVTPSLDNVKGSTFQSSPVVIANSPPALRSFAIEPIPAHSTDELTARLEMFDADGDYIRSSFQWKKDKEDIPGATASTLTSDYFKKGDRIGCQVRVSDGESPEVSYHSNETVILNSSPRITSQPSADAIEGSFYEYRVTAEDPDEDTVEFSLTSAPEGMTIDSATGRIGWEIGEAQQEGSFDFAVIALDPEGAQSVQPVTLKLLSKEPAGEQTEEGE